MKKVNFIFYFVFLQYQIGAQTLTPMDNIIKSDTIVRYSIFDENELIYNNPIKDKYQIIIKNESKSDTLELKYWNIPIKRHNLIYFNAQIDDANYLKIAYSVSESKFGHYNSMFNYDNGFNQIYKDNVFKPNIFLFDPINSQQKLFNDFEDITIKFKSTVDNLMYSDETISQIFFITENTAFISLCYNDGSSGDGCTKERYFLTDNSQKTEITNKLFPNYNFKIGEEWNKYFSSTVEMVSIDGKYVKEKCRFVISERFKAKNEVLNRIFDSKFNFIGNTLVLTAKINGINIQKGIVQHYFLNSHTDENSSQKRSLNGSAPVFVIIPYKFNPDLELLMYKVYYNTVLTQNDIQNFGKYELGILRNLIFAKYNYSFSSEFYQAYFNLYEFYNSDEMRKTRVKDVNDKLTTADKTNIQLIKDMENQR
jgi:hypothetical protein